MNKLDPELLNKVAEAAGGAAQAIVQSEQYLTALARSLIREAAQNPGGFSRRPLSQVDINDSLTTPAPMEDGSLLILTNFPIDSATCYTIMVLPDPERQHDDDDHHAPVKRKGPTEVGVEPEHVRSGTIWHNYSTICYKDQPGQATENRIVQMQPDEQEEVQRQLNNLAVRGVKWYYLTKLVKP